MKPPNIILIISDQQRHDTLNVAGHHHMITPNLDNLATGGGTLFEQAFSPAATCVTSRAAIFTGMYPHNTGVYNFKIWCHQRSWVQNLADAGYHCVNIGKMHIMPIYENIGFHERYVVENKEATLVENHQQNDAWGTYLRMHGLERPLDRHETDPDWSKKFQAVTWEHDEELHSDTFVGDLALQWLERWDGEQPVFLEVGFPGPHDPYDPVERFLEKYDDIDMPPAVYRDGELDEKPPEQRIFRETFSSKRRRKQNALDIESATDDDIARMRKHYAANITQIDEKIGQIMQLLADKGMLENSVIIFTSDHGDNLGDHKLPYKWLMYDTITHIPLIIRDFREGATEIQEIGQLVSLIDLGPTILDYASCDIPVYLEGQSLRGYLEEGTIDSPYEYVFAEDNHLTMIRSETHKLVYYTGQTYGELYDLEQDPHELDNLWDDPDASQIKTELLQALFAWLARSNYFNAGYKQTRSSDYETTSPESGNYTLLGTSSHYAIKGPIPPSW